MGEIPETDLTAAFGQGSPLIEDTVPDGGKKAALCLHSGGQVVQHVQEGIDSGEGLHGDGSP